MTEARAELVETLTVTELCDFFGVERIRITTMVEYGILTPKGGSEAEWAFDAGSICRAVKARRLECDLGLNDAGIALVLDLLDDRAALLQQLQGLKTPD